MSDSAPGVFPTPLQALGLTVAVGLLRALLVLMVPPELGGRPAFVGMATIASIGAILALAAPRLGESPTIRFGFVPSSSWAWLAVPFLAASLLLISEVENLLQPLFEQPEPAPDQARDLAGWIELALVLVLVVPVCEEIFFRGLIQPGLAQRTGPRAAVGMTAVLNGLVWALPYALALPAYALRFFTLYAGMGLVLSLLREAAGSIRPALALAPLFGAISLLASARAVGIPGFDSEGGHTPLEWLAPASLLCGAGLGFCRVAARVRRS